MSRVLIIFVCMLVCLLAPQAHAGEIQIKKISARIFEVNGGSGERAWHIQYGGGAGTFLTLAGPGATAYFSHGTWLRRVDVEKGVVTGRWAFPGSNITKIEWKNDLIQVEVDEQIYRKTMRRVIDFDPESPDIPYWPMMSTQNIGITEGLCCLAYANTTILASKVKEDQAKMWLAEVENAVRRDPLSPWPRIELANIYTALGRPEAAKLYEEAVGIPSFFSEYYKMSAALHDIGRVDLAREAFERGYADYWRRGNDPRLVFFLFSRLLGYQHPRQVPEELRSEVIERVYKVGPRTEYAVEAWTAYAQFLEAKGKTQEAEEWHRRADDARMNSLHPGTDNALWLLASSLLAVTALIAALLYFVALYLRYLPQRRARSRVEIQSGFRFSLLGVEYWRRPERIAFFTIVAIGWLAVGSIGPLFSEQAVMAIMPIGITTGNFAGPLAIAHFENELPQTPERDLLLAMAYHHDRQPGKAEALYRRLTEYPESWNNLGALLKDAGKSSEARQAFERALQLNPELPEARWNLGQGASDLWTQLHEKYLPDRAMLAPPHRDHFLRAHRSTLHGGTALQVLQGPFALAKGAQRLRGWRLPIPMLVYVAIAINILLFVPALIIAVLKPARKITESPYKIHTLIEFLLPGTAAEWKYWSGIVLVGWTYAATWLVLSTQSRFFAFFGESPNLQSAFAIPVAVESVQDPMPSGLSYFLAALLALWLVNAVLISYSRRRKPATIPTS